MPELPEVESVRVGLAVHVADRRVAAVEVLHPRSVRRHAAGPDDLAAQLVGQTFQAPRRRGKYLWFPLGDAARAMVAHLGMSGQFRVTEPGRPDEPHLRVRLRLDDGSFELRFVDQRTFGGLAVEPVDDDGVPTSVQHIARDPFDPHYDRSATAARIRSRRTDLKRALLDQTVVSGIGNIYADEALWRARLHPMRATQRLRPVQAREVLQAAADVMAEALQAGGTSFDRLYVDVNGESGWFGRSLQVYGREGEPCARCGRPVRRQAFMNRSSYVCVSCQRPPRGVDRSEQPS